MIIKPIPEGTLNELLHEVDNMNMTINRIYTLLAGISEPPMEDSLLPYQKRMLERFFYE